MAIIELHEISKLYGFGDAATVALDEVTLNVDAGEFVAIMGPSGCGKSTLLNAIGLLDRPTHGVYQLNGRDVARLRPNRQARIRRDQIGFVFQSLNLLPRLSAIENVALPLAYKGVSQRRRLHLASTMLERVGLHGREYYTPSQLSGGQTQSIAIARALINNPPIIIADEPTGNLDSAASRLVMELLSEIHQAGTTILLVTHNPELTRYATRVMYMRDGAIVQDETTRIGQVAPTARKALYYYPHRDEEDDLAGVSVLMQKIPGSTRASSKTGLSKRRQKSKRRTRRTKKDES